MSLHQRYYNLISLKGEDFVHRTDKNGRIQYKVKKSLSPDLFNSALNYSLETIQLEKVYRDVLYPNESEVTAKNSFAFGLKKSQIVDYPISEDSVCLGYQLALINVHPRSLYKRRKLYELGFYFRKKHYVRYKRSSSSARDGSCLFILEDLYREMMEWSSCGITDVPQNKQADFQSYISLTLSNIKTTFSLPKKSLLLMDDVSSVFADRVMKVAINHAEDSKPSATATPAISVIKNTIWDGQAMMEADVFNSFTDFPHPPTMALLRNKFFKSCAFKTHLQQWFKDNQITEVSQLNGYTCAEKIEDIKLVFTTSSLKYFKFGKENKTTTETFLDWLNGFDGNDLTFGVVKTDSPSKYFNGKLCTTNYQFLSTINLSKNDVDLLLEPTCEHLRLLRTNPLVFHLYTKMKSAGIQDNCPQDTKYNYEVYNRIFPLTSQITNVAIMQTFRNNEIADLKRRIKSGKVFIEGSYATLFGNCIEFLYATIHKGYDPNRHYPLLNHNGEPIKTLSGNTVYTKFFSSGTKICGARSPHITMGNLFLAESTENEFINQYFDLSDTIICINAINQNVLNRLNGADYDSDTMLITNNRVIIDAVQKHYNRFLVPYIDLDTAYFTKNISSEDMPVSVTPEILADLDAAISRNLIGQISYLAFVLNNLLWDRYQKASGPDTIYEIDPLYEALAILAVLSNLEIDKAKRGYTLSIASLFYKIRREISILMYTSTKHMKVPIPNERPRYVLPAFIGFVLEYRRYKYLLIDCFSPKKKPAKKKDASKDTSESNIKKIDLFPVDQWDCTLSHLYDFKFHKHQSPNGSATTIELAELLRKDKSKYASMKTDNSNREKSALQKNAIEMQTTLTQLRNTKNEDGEQMYGYRYIKKRENVLQQSFFYEASESELDPKVIWLILNSKEPPCNALLFAGLVFSKDKHLLRMLYEANKDEETFELVPAEEGDSDTVSLYGHLYKKQKIAKEELPFIKSLLEKK